jgi:drug/metabolite transporter (DMT)-like permease
LTASIDLAFATLSSVALIFIPGSVY